MKKGHIKKAAVVLKDAEKPPYEPTAMEAEAIAAYRVVKATRGPRIKVSIEGDVAKINHRSSGCIHGHGGHNASDGDHRSGLFPWPDVAAR
jgi:hypothetical protein